jgi:predicted transcriptional regulator of viral defense system
LVRGSYVSLQSALAHHGLIPEYVPVTTSVSPGRPARRDTPLGAYLFRHIKPSHLHGYGRVEVSPGQWAFVASPAKALLDLVYLHPGGDSGDYLRELRLQNLERVDPGEMERLVDRASSPKLRRAAARLAEMARAEAREYESL